MITFYFSEYCREAVYPIPEGPHPEGLVNSQVLRQHHAEVVDSLAPSITSMLVNGKFVSKDIICSNSIDLKNYHYMIIIYVEF